MLRIRSLSLPDRVPNKKIIESSNYNSYDPEFWEFQYELNRYLENLSDDALISRYKSIIQNMKLLVSTERDVIPIQTFLSSWYWFRKEHQNRLEFVMRDIALPFSFPKEKLYSKIDPPVEPSSPNSGDILFRYDKRKYLEPMLKDGQIRLSPATSYLDKKLGSARADEETTKYSYRTGTHTNFKTADGKLIRVNGNIQRSISASDYYMLCFSCDWDPSLFSSFDNANACLIIHSPQEFAKRLEIEARAKLQNWYFHHNPIEYFDPFEMSSKKYFSSTMCKDFKFAYQREYRFLWDGLEKETAKNYVHLEIGSIEDIAEIRLNKGYAT